MGKDILLAVWFFLPAGVANMSPIIAQKLPLLASWDHPVDRGASFRGRQLLGPHKTWRGFAAGIVAGTLALWVQQLACRHFPALASTTAGINYQTLPTFILGPLFGVGALGGDAVESFFKRQRGTPSGHAWFPFDQIDYIIGAILATMFVTRLPAAAYVWAVCVWPLAHVAVSYLGFRLGLKERPI